MKKSLQLLVAMLLTATLATAQSAEDVKSNPGEYLYGEGVGSTLQQADRQALAELISQISVTVESSFTHQVVEEGQGAGSFSEKVKSVVNTYSNATLTNAERLIVNDEPNARVMRYIRRADLQKIFDQRRRRINDFIVEAGQYASRAQVADALKYYYWALVLLRSHPDANSLVLEGDASRPLLNVWIPARINDLFAGLSFSLGPWQQENGYTAASLRVSYQGAPARNFDYTWFDGRDWGRGGVGQRRRRIRGDARNRQTRHGKDQGRVHVCWRGPRRQGVGAGDGSHGARAFPQRLLRGESG